MSVENGSTQEQVGPSSDAASSDAVSSVAADSGHHVAPGAQPLLDARDIVTHFQTHRGLVRAVDGVSLSLERGKTLGVVGESGSGKSVLARSIMGLVPRKGIVRSGEVFFEGREISALADRELRDLWGHEMAMIFQDPMTALNPVMKIGRQITESLRFHLHMDKSDARDTAVELLHAVKIPEAKRRFSSYPHEMSGGMRQRVVIAVALACGPKLLFADEPTTALDVTVQSQILDLLAEKQRERDMAMILVTHDLGVVASRADEIAVMYAGKIVEQAPTRTLFSDLKMPYTEALLSAIPRLALPSHTRLAAIGGRPPDLTNPPPGCSFAPRCPYVRERCREEEPSLIASPEDPKHLFACFYPVGSPETQEIKLAMAAHRSQTSTAMPMPDTSAPDTSAPDTSAPDTSAPDTSAPDTSAPDTSAPDTADPGTAEGS